MVLNDKVHSLNGEIKFSKNEKSFTFYNNLEMRLIDSQYLLIQKEG